MFVARFLGESSLFHGTVIDPRTVDVGGRRVVAGRGDADSGATVAVVVRPERIRIVVDPGAPPAGNAVPGRVLQHIYLGNSRKVEVRLPDDTVVLVRESAGSITRAEPGQDVWLTFGPDNAAILPADATN